MTAADELSRFEFDIMLVLAKTGGTYGLGVKEAIEQQFDRKVNHGRLYPNLDDLIEDGYVQKTAVDQRTNEYALTPQGVEAVRKRIDWFTDAVSERFIIRSRQGTIQLEER